MRLPGGTTVRVRAVGTRRDGRLAVPEDVRSAGWWRGGSRVGDPFGAMLVAGHVDSRTQGLGAYAELLTVRRGQEVVVGTDSLRQTYLIRSLRLVPQAPLSARSPLALAPRPPATGPGHLRAAVRRDAGRLPAPRRGDGVPGRPPGPAEPLMSGKKPPRPLAQPVVPRQRRYAAPREEPAPDPPPPPPPVAEPVADDPEPGDPRVLAAVLTAVVVLAVVVAAVVMLLRSDDLATAPVSRGDATPSRPSPRGPHVVRRHPGHRRRRPGGAAVAARQLTDCSVCSCRRPRPWDRYGSRTCGSSPAAGSPGAETLRRGRGSYALHGQRGRLPQLPGPGRGRAQRLRARAGPGPVHRLVVRVSPRMVATTYAVGGGEVLALACVRRSRAPCRSLRRPGRPRLAGRAGRGRPSRRGDRPLDLP